jgi:hypothetical protein
MRAMAVAAIDQDVTFSTVSSDFGLDDRALVEAHVLQQSAAIQLASDEPFTVADPNVAPFAFLPPVLDYRLTAPVVFNDLLPETSDVEANPLADLVNGGPGPLHTEPMVLLTRDSQVSGDQPVTETAAMDRSFWFMVFATHLDSVTAYEMSNSIEQSGLQLVAGADGTCAVASFSSGNATANAELTGRLARWAETTAVELGATVTSLPDSSVQLRSCDPVGSYTFSGRFGVSRQLLGWRATELALITSVTELGGTDDTVAAALPLLAQSEAVLAVTELPAGTPADEVAAAAEAAAVDIANAVMALDAAAESGES